MASTSLRPANAPDISYSGLALFKDCPRQFFYRHVEQRPYERYGTGSDPRPSFEGDVVMRLLERFYIERWWKHANAVDTMMPRVPEIVQQLTDAAGLHWPFAVQQQIVTSIQARLVLLVTAVRAEKLLTTKTYTETELVLKVPTPDGVMTVHGRADFIFDGPELWLVDGKDGKVVGRYAKRDQLRLYALMLEADPRFGRLPAKAGFWWFRHGRVTWHVLKPERVAEYRAELQTAVEEWARVRITGQYEARPAQTLCGECPFQTLCPEGTAFLDARRSRALVDVAGNGNKGWVQL